MSNEQNQLVQELFGTGCEQTREGDFVSVDTPEVQAAAGCSGSCQSGTCMNQ